MKDELNIRGSRFVASFAVAVATMEGFYRADSLSARNNNPGNLRTWGELPTENGYVRFPTASAGWTALRTQIRKNIGRGLNTLEFFGGKAGVYPGFAPKKDRNDPANYAAFVAKRLGIDPSVPLKKFTEV